MNKPIKVGSDCAGVGAFPQSLKRLNINFTEKFACDFDYYARVNYCKNYGTDADLKIALSKEHKRYADKVKEIVLRDKTPSEKEIAFLNEANEFAKKFSFYFPFNMYQREIPAESLDIYVGSFPCQSFSLAGIRKGEEDKRGVLFYCGHDFIEKNRPRYFIIENVKGLLSDDGGRTFQRWIDYLGSKSVNGTQIMFPEENSLPYHVYYSVLNAKDYGVPQNRERIFIIGIRDDADNNFNFPKPFPLVKRLKDVLENNVDQKYYLSEKMINGLVNHQKFNKFNPTYGEDSASCITARVHKMGNADNYIKVGYINQDTQASQVIHEDSVSQTLCAGTHGYANGYVQTFDTPKVKFQLTGGKWDKTHEQSGRVYDENGIEPTIHTMGGGNQEPKISEDYRIRKLTPRECFRLMDFPDTFDFSVVSDSQAYKQAGNSIVVNVLAQIISKFNLNA